MNFLLLLAILKSTLTVSDISFINFCENVAGTLTKHQQQQQQNTRTEGDKCVVNWPIPVESLEAAQAHCNTFNMYVVKNVEIDNGYPVCHYENVFECKHSYILIRGYCYRFMSEEFQKYEDGEKMCADDKIPSTKPNTFIKAEMLKLLDPALIRQLTEYFRDMRLVFIQPTTEYFEKVAYHGDGEHYAISYSTSQFYKVPEGSIIRVRKGQTARILCFYRAEETLLSYRHNVEKLAPFYHKANLDGDKVIWRSAGYYSVKDDHNPDSLSKICETSMKTIVRGAKGGVWNPEKKEIAKLSENMKNSLVVASSGIQTCDKDDNKYEGYIEWPHVFFRTHSQHVAPVNWSRPTIILSNASRQQQCQLLFSSLLKK